MSRIKTVKRVNRSGDYVFGSGVALDVLRSFTSRTNDVEGYWGIGKLCRRSQELKQAHFELDLLAGQVFPPRSLEDLLAERYHLLLRKCSLRITDIRRASLQISFDFENAARKTEAANVRFECRLILHYRTDKTQTAESGGWCWPHDPSRERRRAPSHWGR